MASILKKPATVSVVIAAQPGCFVAEYCGDDKHTDPLDQCLVLDPIIAWRITYEEGEDESAYHAAITVGQGEVKAGDFLCPDGKVHNAGGAHAVAEWLAAEREAAIKLESSTVRLRVKREDAEGLV